jgi:hypothetical protein
MAKSICSRTLILAALAAMPGLAQSTPAPVGQEAQKAQLDSTEQSLDGLEGQARRSLFSGGSKPVSFSGEALMRFIGTSYDQYPSWMEKDATETKNSLASVRIGMVVAPHRTLRLWSKIAFNSALMGYNKPSQGTTDGEGWTSTPQTGYFDPHSSAVYEDMAAGLVAKTGPVTTSVKIGGTLWAEASPLSVWKGQNRMFGWDYVPYELEQSGAQYWEYNTLKGEKTGRAAWNKKPFQGLMMESVEMPENLHYALVYGEYEGFQKWRENVVNTSNTNGLMFTQSTGNTGPGVRTFFDKGVGIGDSYHKTFLARLDKSELPGAVTAGFNYVNYHTDDDYAKQWNWGTSAGLGSFDPNPISAWSRRIVDNQGKLDTFDHFTANYFLSSQVVSVDARRTLPGGLQFHVDLAMGQVDTSYFKVNVDGSNANLNRYNSTLDTSAIIAANQFEVVGHRKSDWTPAIYGMASYPLQIASKNYDLLLTSVFAPKNFYSGTSFIIPVDAFFPYESNLVGAGKFASSDNGSPYASNTTGANLVTKLPIPNGHARVSFGYHQQIEKGGDLIFLPWRLNGTAFKYSQNASSTQYDGVGLIDDFLRENPAYGDQTNTNRGAQLQANAKYGVATPGRFRQVRRFGDEFYAMNNPDNLTSRRNNYSTVPGLAGGIRTDFLSTYEGFGAFKLSKDPAQRKLDSAKIAAMMISDLMPQSTKGTQNLSFDATYDIARLWKGKNSVFLGVYGALNSVTESGSPLPSLSDNDKTFLRGTFVRFEPVVQLTSKFFLIGMVGRETWNSSYGVAAIDSVTGYSLGEGSTTSAATPNPDLKAADPRNWHSAPIDYTDWAYGVGFDWDMASRVGVHVRLQHFTHVDDGISAEVKPAKGKNDYKAWLLHAETKMWF